MQTPALTVLARCWHSLSEVHGPHVLAAPQAGLLARGQCALPVHSTHVPVVELQMGRAGFLLAHSVSERQATQLLVASQVGLASGQSVLLRQATH